MTTHHPTDNEPDDELGAWLATQYAALVDDLSATLDIAAGNAEATQATHFIDLVTDLNEALDLDAGLVAIVGPGAAAESASCTSPALRGNEDERQSQHRSDRGVCDACGTTNDDAISLCSSCGEFLRRREPASTSRPADVPTDSRRGDPEPDGRTFAAAPAGSKAPNAASARGPAPEESGPNRSGRPSEPTPDNAVTGAIACLDAGRRLALEQERPDLAARLEAARARLTTKSVPVAVVGNFKRGKSTLVNALLRYNVCPVDADIVTAVPTLVRYGEQTAVSGFFDSDGPDEPLRAEPLALEDPPEALAEFGEPDGKRLNSVEVRVRHPLLRSGLCLLDTPSVGELDSAQGVVTLGALDVAQGVLFVTDASQELTAAELTFLKMVLDRCPLAACVVTKTDLYPHWRRIVDLDRLHLARAGLDLPVFGVSSFLRLHSRDDAALEDESGFRPLSRWLATDVLGPADTRAARSAVSDVRFVAGQLGGQVEAEREVVARPQESERLVAQLAKNQERTARLASPTATWQQTLTDQVQDLAAEVEYDLLVRVRDVVRRVEAVIDRGDPKDAWPDVDAWLRREAATAVIAVYDEMGRRAKAVAADVASRFDLEAGSAVSFEWPAPTEALGSIDVEEFTSSGSGRLMTDFLAARSGAFVPTVLSGAASHIPVAAPGAALFLGPLRPVLTAGIGAKVLRGERAPQLAHRRRMAKTAAHRYLDELAFMVGRDCQHTLRLTQRQLRDEFLERAGEMHRWSQATLDASQRARHLDGQERSKQASSLDRRAERLRELYQRVAEVASTAPAGVVGHG